MVMFSATWNQTIKKQILYFSRDRFFVLIDTRTMLYTWQFPNNFGMMQHIKPSVRTANLDSTVQSSIMQSSLGNCRPRSSFVDTTLHFLFVVVQPAYWPWTSLRPEVWLCALSAHAHEKNTILVLDMNH
ncbi:hypothetical protein VPH35_018974 [Triticum aestivum]